MWDCSSVFPIITSAVVEEFSAVVKVLRSRWLAWLTEVFHIPVNPWLPLQEDAETQEDAEQQHRA